MRKRKVREYGKWVFVPDTDDEVLEKRKDDTLNRLACFADTFEQRWAALKQMEDYFPGDNIVDEHGSWIMVKQPPHTEYTVPPLSMWFATPWPSRHQSVTDAHRVKIVTPRGDLGLFPHEYSKIKDVSKYFEFIGKDMEIHFFGSTDGVPVEKLHYIMSRGISRTDAITMLIGEIKHDGVCWLETKPEISEYFGYSMPSEERLSTL